MKKLFCIALPLIMALGLLAACSSAGENGEVNVYNWGEYFDKDLIKAFEKETGIKVNYTEFPSNEHLYSKLQTDVYDVIFPSDYMISRLIAEDMLEKIDFSNIPNFSLISDDYKNLDYDPTNEYSVPYMWGTVGIIYNPEVVTQEVDSWSILWDEKYSGQILQFDNPRDAVATALLSLGYSLNTTNQEEIRQAYDLLEQQKGILQKYVMDQIYTLMESGEAAIGPYYAGDYLMMLENNPDLRFAVPKEGTNFFVDAMCIPKGAKNKANAEAFINFMCSTDACIASMDETGYASPNSEAIEQYKQDYDLSDPEDAYQFAIMFPEKDVLETYQIFDNLPAEINALYSDLWTVLKSK